jgi:hypothetical protein
MTRQERVVAPHHHLTRPSAPFIPSSSERRDSGPLTIPIVAETAYFAPPSANDRYFTHLHHSFQRGEVPLRVDLTLLHCRRRLSAFCAKRASDRKLGNFRFGLIPAI